MKPRIAVLVACVVLFGVLVGSGSAGTQRVVRVFGPLVRVGQGREGNVMAACPPGSGVVAGGFLVPSDGQEQIESDAPHGNGWAVRVLAWEDLSVRAVAECLR